MRKGLRFSSRKRGIFWLECHIWSDLLSLNDVCYWGMSVCMGCMCTLYMGIVLVFKASSKRILQLNSNISLREHTKLRERERDRRSARSRNPSMLPVVLACRVPKPDLV